MARSCNHCYSGEAISITYSECVFVALGIQHSMRMRPITLSGSTMFFHIIPYTTRFLGVGGGVRHKCVWSFSTNFLWTFLILRRTLQDVIKNVYCSSRKVPVILLDYYTNHCTYITLIQFAHSNIKNAPTCFGPKTIKRELYIPC